jgi:hypothetical protein
MSTKAAQSDVDSVRSDWIFEREFALRFYEAVNTGKAIRAHMHLSRGEYADLNSLSCNSRDYQEPRHFAEDYQVAELLRKSINIPGVTDSDREAKALSKLFAAEARNAETNAKLMDQSQPEWFGEFSANVLRILGPLDDRVLNEIADLGKFGPGTNVGVRSEGLVPSIKYDAKPVVTPNLAPLLPALMPAMVLDFWGDNLLPKTKHAKGNGHFTVPKNWEVKRCAAKEPLWNSYLQAGIGKHMTRRLLRFGVDLHDQRWNQTLAEMALEWALATLDLSSASDLLCRVLVWLTLCYNQDPDGLRWFHLLQLARSPAMVFPAKGVLHPLEMFASMGNGFTFPLETIIFLAVIRTVVPRKDWCVTTAYGDDMIVPQQYARQVVERLEYLGFQVNSKKTCLAGTFFESCGTDWFNSQNVRPFYLHKSPENPAPYPLQAANSLRAWCIRVFGELPARYAPLWRWCKGQVRSEWRNLVPPELGDVGVHVGRTEAIAKRAAIPCPQVSGCGELPPYNGWEGYIVKYVRLAPVNADRRSFGVLANALSQQVGVQESASNGLEPVRGLYGRLRTEKGVVIWDDDFAWQAR